MRESFVRPCRVDRRARYALAAASLLAPLALSAQCLSGAPLPAWRALVVQLSLAAGVPQGATLLAALVCLCAPRWRPGLRRVAEALALGLPLSPLAHLLSAGAGAVLDARSYSSFESQALSLGAATALALVGVLYLHASVAPDVVERYQRGEVDGVVPRLLARVGARPSPARARVLALAYLGLYLFAAPVLPPGLTLPVRGAFPGPLFGPYVALSDATVAAAICTVAAAALRLSRERRELLSPRDVGAAASTLIVLAAAVALLLALQLAAVLGHARDFDGGVLPREVPWGGWRALAVCALTVGYLAPCLGLLSRDARASGELVLALGAVALLGAWLDRCALLAPARAPGFAAVDVACAAGFAAAGALGLLTALGAAGPDLAPAGARRNSLGAAL